nr:immunoglobulin heavy chain junction region [Mus musculus]MBK4197252.1 immunoglobulin heavy chain junction region [Mus musculus]MBK4197253.1 immunoglobulin heavy chain junction region [Mus musculus]
CARDYGSSYFDFW